MSDVSPILLESVKKLFDMWFYADKEVKKIYKKVKNGTATFSEMKLFSERAGAILSSALRATLTADKLPDGKLYQNIAEKVITPMLKQNHELITEVCGYVGDDINKAARIGTKAVTAPFNSDKAKTVAQIASNSNGVANGSKAAQLVENATMSMVDDFIRANLDFQKLLGNNPQIIRIYHAGKNKCDFCNSLQYSGEYKGAGMPWNIFQRHRDCKCTLIYSPQKGKYQDPWSKKEMDSYTDIVSEQRKYLTELDKMSPAERKTVRNARARELRRSQYSPEEWERRKAEESLVRRQKNEGKEYRKLTESRILEEQARQNEKRLIQYKNLEKVERIKKETAKIKAEYINQNISKKAIIKQEAGYKVAKHKEEVKCAEWIKKKFGGEIYLLKEINKDNIKTPDYRWNGKLWEHKSASSINSISQQVRKGIKQIWKNPGGIIVELRNEHGMQLSEIFETVENRVKRKKMNQSIDVIIKEEDEIIGIIRSK